jgi:DUF177 domain-containing protein
MRIELDRLRELGERFSHTYQAGELLQDDQDASLAEPAQVRGQIARRGNEIEVRGELGARVEVACARCLKPVLLPVSAEFDERFTPAVSWRAESQHELTEEDLNLAVFDGEAIDLDELIREEILLAIPGHVLCREDCQGLCPDCGIDRNVGSCQCEPREADSPWEGLENLGL